MKTNIEENKKTTIQSRFKNLFEFLKAYNDLRTPVVTDISQQIATLWLNSLPKHPSVKLNEYLTPVKSEIEEDGRQENDVVLEVTRPSMTPCPKPPEILLDWVLPGWTKISQEAEVRKSRNVAATIKGEDISVEQFEDVSEREIAFDSWNEVRNKWAENEQSTWEAVQFFERIYELYGHLEREGERVELLIGEGILECNNVLDGKFRHPVLLQRLELEFCPEKKHPQFILRRRDQPPELCVDFLRVLPNVDTQQLVQCSDELKKMEFDPLGQEDTTGFLRRLVQGLFPNGGQYVDNDQQKNPESITIERDPVIFMRQRRAGLGHAIDLIIQDIAKRLETGEEFSIAMMQILGINHENVILSEEDREISTLGNEDAEILLSKAANQEQLQIAKQLQYKGTVLVQGPPGTGKTHTIANLIGHLLSQGKRVLVTAQTPKALKVLRSEIVPNIQSLCVSVLQKEKQNIEELQLSVRDISVRLSQDEGRLEKTTNQTREERVKIIEELRNLRQQLFDAREDEIREIVFGGKGIRPIEAAKKVSEHKTVNDWIPGPIKLGAGLPITHTDVSVLYQTNAISVSDEKEIKTERPDLNTLPSIVDFTNLIQELKSARTQDTVFGKEYWNENVQEAEPSEFENLIDSATKAIEFFKDSTSWQMQAVQAGRDGDVSKKTWLSLAEFIDYVWKEIQESNVLVMEYGPTVTDPRPVHKTLPIIDEIVAFVENGSSFNLFTRVTKRHWYQFLETAQIGGKAIDLKNKQHLRTIQAFLHVISLREELCARWNRQMVHGGAPTVEELGDKPEQVCRQFISGIKDSLDWHDQVWIPLESELNRLGFKWIVYFEITKPEVGENAQLLRLKAAVLGDFEKILASRLAALHLRSLENRLLNFQKQMPGETKNDGILTRKIRQSLLDTDPKTYAHAYAELDRLKSVEPELKTRHSLLEKITPFAPAWAAIIQTRTAKHGDIQPPGNPESAWEWRQLHDELERRASVSLEDLQQSIEGLNNQLLEVTSTLVEKQTWLNQLKTVANEEKQALNAYATLQAKKTKGGKGKKDETIRAAARKEMETAKGAVPVWIMPLNEVVENFNPINTRFDVVIIDEASQSDPLAMFALYLGKQAVVVGDDEQVTPLAPMGIETEEIMKLIRTYLSDIPHKEFYDGETSIYDFARTSFGNVIRLVEHFRCAPDIIAFSNNLSYSGEIKPLREESSISLHPNVIQHRVSGVVTDNKTNKAEQEAVASLICAAIEQPEYKQKTFGVISLLGDLQAGEIENLIRTKLTADVFQQHQILCGNAAHFQGDQRDVMFLSMVDSPTGSPLNLRDGDANRKLFKKRYNVAASRAKDQMWLVHSLNNETDLKPGDIRKRLIEHMIDPKSWQRERDDLITKADSPFEEKVISRLLEKGFKVQPQYQVGAYRIDMVVSGGGKKVGIECDGEQWHGPDKLQEDMDRQAILERLGWKFIRIRGSVFFRDAERAMATVFQQFEDLGILPEREDTIILDTKNSELIERVQCRAQELQEKWKNQPETEDPV